MTSEYHLRAFCGGAPSESEISDIASLHLELLRESPVVVLGRYFMERFYYRTLVEDGEIFVGLAYVDGRCAGFVVATDDPRDFMSSGIRKRWLRCGWTILLSVLARATRLKALFEALQIQKEVKTQTETRGVGELLSLGVRKEFRTPAFVQKTGKRIPDDLLEMALCHLAERDVNSVRAVVEKDNLEASLFYKARGWTITSLDVMGWESPCFEFRCEIRE